MKPLPFTHETSYEIVSVNGCPYMFTNMRIDRDTIPEGLVAYDVRDDDCDGSFAQIQKFVMVNHWGTIIGKDEIPLDPKWFCYYPDEEKDGWFISDYVESADEYFERYDELKAACQEPPAMTDELVP
jgi:hypothetical protein